MGISRSRGVARVATIRSDAGVMLVLLTALAVSAGNQLSAIASPTNPAQGITARVVVSHVDQSDAFTFAPDGRIFIAEHASGHIDIFDPVSGVLSLFATVPNVFIDGDAGLMGIVLHPRYPTRPFVYVFATRTVSGTPREQILRFTDTGGTGTSPRVILTGNTVANGFHQGGRILFGPDGMLYAIDGDRDDPANAQNPSTDSGKVLRMTALGRVPPDNPFPGSLVWTYGHRNSFGFAFDPITSLLWETEDGPECNDEINIVRAGKNYGWGPAETCSTPPPPPLNTNQDGPNPVLPVTYFGTTTTPVGDVFCTGCGLPDSEGTLFIGQFNDGSITRAVLSPDRQHIASMETVFQTGITAGVLSMERGPDRSLYFSDTHHIYQLVPA